MIYFPEIIRKTKYRLDQYTERVNVSIYLIYPCYSTSKPDNKFLYTKRKMRTQTQKQLCYMTTNHLHVLRDDMKYTMIRSYVYMTL